jgi:hypothetical protein
MKSRIWTTASSAALFVLAWCAVAAHASSVVSRVVITKRTPQFAPGVADVRATRVSATSIRVSIRPNIAVTGNATLAYVARPCVPSSHAKRGFTCYDRPVDASVQLHAGDRTPAQVLQARDTPSLTCVQVSLVAESSTRGYKLMIPSPITVCPR